MVEWLQNWHVSAIWLEFSSIKWKFWRSQNDINSKKRWTPRHSKKRIPEISDCIPKIRIYPYLKAVSVSKSIIMLVTSLKKKTHAVHNRSQQAPWPSTTWRRGIRCSGLGAMVAMFLVYLQNICWIFLSSRKWEILRGAILRIPFWTNQYRAIFLIGSFRCSELQNFAKAIRSIKSISELLL